MMTSVLASSSVERITVPPSLVVTGMKARNFETGIELLLRVGYHSDFNQLTLDSRNLFSSLPLTGKVSKCRKMQCWDTGVN